MPFAVNASEWTRAKSGQRAYALAHRPDCVADAVAYLCRCLWVWTCPAGRGRAVALRVEPLSKAQRLDPDGLPSLTQHGQAGVAG
jgi:hypothetical protein